MSFFWLYLLKFVTLYNASCVGSLFLPLCFSSIYLQVFFMTCGLWLVVWHFQRQQKFNRVSHGFYSCQVWGLFRGKYAIRIWKLSLGGIHWLTLR